MLFDSVCLCFVWSICGNLVVFGGR